MVPTRSETGWYMQVYALRKDSMGDADSTINAWIRAWENDVARLKQSLENECGVGNKTLVKKTDEDKEVIRRQIAEYETLIREQKAKLTMS
jgi:hypothetical protein